MKFYILLNIFLKMYSSNYSPKAPDFYEKAENQVNPLHFKKKKGAKHLTGV